jgi:murein L,D-transpeptidase YcbB/YkuD
MAHNEDDLELETALSEEIPAADWHEPAAAEESIAVVEEVSAPAPTYTYVPEPEPIVVSGNDVDTVKLSACVYKNMHSQKSLTVHHLQRRLAELGYPEADGDIDGFYGDLTLNAVASFQKDKGIEGDGLMDEQTFSSLFAGDPNVVVEL